MSTLFTGISQLVTPVGAGPKRGAEHGALQVTERAAMLVDPHTLAVWGGARLRDFEARAKGVAYEDILRQGGGIRSTMRATAAATLTELIDSALPRVGRLSASGATTIEIKSGYGFTLEAELRMLEAIRALPQPLPLRTVPTLLLHVRP